MKRFVPLLIWSSLFATPCRGEPIEFSDFLLPMDRASFFGWQIFRDQFPTLFNKSQNEHLPNGDTLFIAPNGQVVVTLHFSSLLYNDATERQVILSFFDRDKEFMRMDFTTRGESLTNIPIEALRAGNLPYFPYLPNEKHTELNFWFANGPLLEVDFSIIIEKEDPGFLSAYFYSNGSPLPFLEYREVTELTYREFSYKSRMGPTGHTLKATKYKTEDMFIGTESYYIDDKQVTAGEYLDLFYSPRGNENYGVGTFILQDWQLGFGSIVQSMGFGNSLRRNILGHD